MWSVSINSVIYWRGFNGSSQISSKQHCFKFLNQNSLNPTTSRNFINPAKYQIMRAPWPSFADRGYSDNSIRGETSLWRFQLSVILPYKTCRAFVALCDVIQTYGSSSEYKQLPVFLPKFPNLMPKQKLASQLILNYVMFRPNRSTILPLSHIL